jgi:transposase
MTMDELPTTLEGLRAALLQARHEMAALSATVEEQRGTIVKQERTIVDLLAALRGKRRERIDPNQLVLFELGELEALIEEQANESAPRRKRRPHGRRLLPDDLPREEVLHELPEAQRLCPHDGQPMQPIRYEISQQLDYEPAKLKVIVHKRAVYACPAKHDAATLRTAPKPHQPIDKGLPGPGLLAALVLGKFGDHLPAYRLEDILGRHGVQIRRSTIYDWLSAAADLVEPVVDVLRRRVLQSKVLHTDDTQVKLIDASLHGTRLARYWAYVGDRGHPYIVYDFTDSRQREGPERFLEGYQGYLQADAYGGYDGIYLKSRGAIVEVACWAHCRRYWWKAREQDPPRAHHVLAVIGRLYDVERAARDLSPEARRNLRTEHAAPLVAELQAWLDAQELLPKSLIGQAATYTRNQWVALGRYLEDGDLSIDNNISERTVKPVAIGRKNWLFVGSRQAGERSARLMSLIASCKHNRVEPDSWLADHPQHRWTIADHRQDERAAKGQL